MYGSLTIILAWCTAARIKFLTGRLVKIDLSERNQRHHKAGARRAVPISVPLPLGVYVLHTRASIPGESVRTYTSPMRVCKWRRHARTWNGQIYMANDRRYKVVMSRAPWNIADWAGLAAPYRGCSPYIHRVKHVVHTGWSRRRSSCHLHMHITL